MGIGVAGYDVIGDVHGCATQLRTLLGQLGYREEGGVYRHPTRTAAFVGDLIDRGPEQREVLQIVKAMADAGTARVAMGNHEFNAICYTIPDPANPGDYLRTHSDQHTAQHRAFLTQLSPAEQQHYVDWFTSLPLWLDLGGLRVVHACWHEPSIRTVLDLCGTDRLNSSEHYVEASRPGSPLFEAVETLLKGPEIGVPAPYFDPAGHRRSKARVRWWDADARTLREIADVRGMLGADGAAYPPLPAEDVGPEYLSYGYCDPVPVVYGHYWFQWEANRDDWTDRTACVDFSAIMKGGRLVAYRWAGEAVIDSRNFHPHTADRSG